jgi:hypothetical protein
MSADLLATHSARAGDTVGVGDVNGDGSDASVGGVA